jgi:hypothetical protein
MRIYKLHLLLINSRYGDLEQRLIRLFAKDRTTNEVWLMGELEILLMYLLEDELLEDTKQTRAPGGGVEQKLYRWTRKGRDYIAQWPQI